MQAIRTLPGRACSRQRMRRVAARVRLPSASDTGPSAAELARDSGRSVHASRRSNVINVRGHCEKLPNKGRQVRHRSPTRQIAAPASAHFERWRCGLSRVRHPPQDHQCVGPDLERAARHTGAVAGHFGEARGAGDQGMPDDRRAHADDRRLRLTQASSRRTARARIPTAGATTRPRGRRRSPSGVLDST